MSKLRIKVCCGRLAHGEPIVSETVVRTTIVKAFPPAGLESEQQVRNTSAPVSWRRFQKLLNRVNSCGEGFRNSSIGSTRAALLAFETPLLDGQGDNLGARGPETPRTNPSVLLRRWRGPSTKGGMPATRGPNPPMERATRGAPGAVPRKTAVEEGDRMKGHDLSASRDRPAAAGWRCWWWRRKRCRPSLSGGAARWPTAASARVPAPRSPRRISRR
jgi:hypothetical protein